MSEGETIPEHRDISGELQRALMYEAAQQRRAQQDQYKEYGIFCDLTNYFYDSSAISPEARRQRTQRIIEAVQENSDLLQRRGKVWYPGSRSVQSVETSDRYL